MRLLADDSADCSEGGFFPNNLKASAISLAVPRAHKTPMPIHSQRQNPGPQISAPRTPNAPEAINIVTWEPQCMWPQRGQTRWVKCTFLPQRRHLVFLGFLDSAADCPGLSARSAPFDFPSATLSFWPKESSILPRIHCLTSAGSRARWSRSGPTALGSPSHTSCLSPYYARGRHRRPTQPRGRQAHPPLGFFSTHRARSI